MQVVDSTQSNAPGAATPLPVLAGPRLRRSRAGWWRAASLVFVHILVIVHVLHWRQSGRTLGPLEPSEGMRFFQEGVINAGLLFFALAILSTAVLGRWFCGWACHVVALQDASAWLLARAGLRPKPLRSRLLVLVPLLALLYMFLAPWIYRALDWAGGAPTPLVAGIELTTTSFWSTFPSWVPAILTFVTCGFVAVYFLGSKGFCTNACPYGAAFAAADRVAPLRIRVTDACTGSGHCTAVCSSNVRVHEEVRDFRRVVDPGCMKCLDCVQVCPNDALYFGRGPRPAQPAPKPARRERGGARRTAAPATEWKSWIVRGLFTIAAIAIFIGSDRAYLYDVRDLAVVAIVSLLGLGAAWLMRVAPRRREDHTWMDEAVLGGAFLGSMLAFRGPGMAAFLFALGLSAVLAYLVLLLTRLARDRQLSLHRWRLKRAGRLLPAGAAFAAGMALVFAGAAFAAARQSDSLATRRLSLRIAALEPTVRHAPSPASMDALLSLYRRLWQRTPDDLNLALRFGWLLTARGHYDEARAVYDAALTRHPGQPRLLTNYGVCAASAGQLDEAVEWFRQAVVADAKLLEARSALAEALAALGRTEAAIAEYQQIVALSPAAVEAWAGLALLHAQSRRWAAAQEAAQRALQLAPQRADLARLHNQILDAARRTPDSLPSRDTP